MNYFFDAVKSCVVGLLSLSIIFGIVELFFPFGYWKILLLSCAIGVILCLVTLLGYIIRASLE
jgi:hypothetical protein